MMRRTGIGCLAKNLISLVLCELVHCHDRGAMFLQSTFLVIFFILHPSLASELPDHKLD